VVGAKRGGCIAQHRRAAPPLCSSQQQCADPPPPPPYRRAAYYNDAARIRQLTATLSSEDLLQQDTQGNTVCV